MSLPLFRDEALQARRHSWLGEVVLDQPPSTRILAAVMLLAGIAVVLLLVFGEYTRRARVAGQLVPTHGLATVVAPLSGVIAELRVQEGQRLLPEQPMLQVVVPGTTHRAGNTRESVDRSVLARIEGLRAGHRSHRQRLRDQAGSLTQQKALAELELAQVTAELATRQRQQDLAEQAALRFRLLHAQRYVTDLQLQQQESQALEIRGGVQALLRQQVGVRQKIAQLSQAQQEIPSELEASEAMELRERMALEQERIELHARGESVVVAPIAGSVGVLFVHPGQTVQAGQPLLSLLPAASQLEAHLAVPGAAIGFVSPGDEVRLRYAAYPYQKFGQQRGRVVRISRNALAADEGGSEPTYRVVVALERQYVRTAGEARPLRPGLVLEADILGERRRLWEWLVEPLQTLRGQLTAERTEIDGASADAAPAYGLFAQRTSSDQCVVAATFQQRLAWSGLWVGMRFCLVAEMDEFVATTALMPTGVGAVWWSRPQSAGFQGGTCHA